jgi:hypothetical protein
MSDERQLVSNKLGNIEDALGEMVNGQRALIEAVRALKPAPETDEAACIVANTNKTLYVEVERRRAENEEARKQLASLFLHYAPQCEPLPDLLGVVSQIDNCMTQLRELKRFRDVWPTVQDLAKDSLEAAVNLTHEYPADATRLSLLGAAVRDFKIGSANG